MRQLCDLVQLDQDGFQNRPTPWNSYIFSTVCVCYSCFLWLCPPPPRPPRPPSHLPNLFSPFLSFHLKICPTQISIFRNKVLHMVIQTLFISPIPFIVWLFHETFCLSIVWPLVSSYYKLSVISDIGYMYFPLTWGIWPFSPFNWRTNINGCWSCKDALCEQEWCKCEKYPLRNEVKWKEYPIWEYGKMECICKRDVFTDS